MKREIAAARNSKNGEKIDLDGLHFAKEENEFLELLKKRRKLNPRSD